MRLERRVSELSRLSRSEARTAVRRGRVTVDGVVQRDPGLKIDQHAITLDGRLLEPPPRLALFHKEVGVQCTVGDPQGRPSLQETAASLLELGLHPVGRLDADTSGLLIFSGDGQLTQRLLHPRHHAPKTYVATVEGTPGQALVAGLTEGVETGTGVHSAEQVQVDGDRVTLTVFEGKHRMVRRMLANLGHPVLALHRVRFGEWELGELAPGAWMLIP